MVDEIGIDWVSHGETDRPWEKFPTRVGRKSTAYVHVMQGIEVTFQKILDFRLLCQKNREIEIWGILVNCPGLRKTRGIVEK